MPQTKFKLRDTDPNITEDSAFGTAWRDTWKFQCPQHMSILLQKGDTFSIYAEDSGDVEYVAPDAQIRIEVRDPSEQKVINVYGPENYISATDFQQLTKKAKLDIDQPIHVKPRDFIVIQTKDSTGMDSASVANSYAVLETTKITD